MPVDVDWNNPLCDKLAFVNTPFSRLESPLKVPTRIGICHSFNPAISFNIDTKVVNAQVVSHSGFIIVRHPSMLNGRSPNYMGCRVSSNNGWAFYQNNATSSYPTQTMGLGYVHGGVAAYGFSSSGVSGANTNYVPLGFSATVSGNLSLYAYGNSVYSTSIGGINQSSDSIRVGRDVYFNTNPGDYETPLFAYWKRRLTSEEHASLSANPWQIFRPINRINYFLPPQYQQLNESSADSSTYISASSSGLITRVGLQATSDPGNDNNHVLRYRADHDNADGRGVNVKVVETGSFPFIVPRKQVWTSQPQVPVEIRQEFADRILSVSVPFSGGFVTYKPRSGRVIYPLGLPSVISHGLCAKLNGTSDGYVISSSSGSKYFLDRQDFTLIAAIKVGSASGARTICSSNSAIGYSGIQFRLNGSAISLVNGGTAEFLNTGAVVSAGELCVIGATRNGNVPKAYKNGKLIYTASTYSTALSDSQAVIGQRGNSSEYFDGSLACLIALNGGDDRDAINLTNNPWQIFKPRTQITYVDLGYKLIATRTPTLTTSPADYTIDLTTEEAALITDYSNLALEVEST